VYGIAIAQGWPNRPYVWDAYCKIQVT